MRIVSSLTLVAAALLGSCAERPKPVKTVDVIMPLEEALEKAMNAEPTPIDELLRAWGRHEWRFDDEVALPVLDYLGLTKVGPPALEAKEAGGWLGVVTVHVPAEGPPAPAGFQRVSRWRGIEFPRHSAPLPDRVGDYPLRVVVHVSERQIKFGPESCEGLDGFKRELADLLTRAPDARLVVEFDRATTFGVLLPVLAVMLESGTNPLFRRPATGTEPYQLASLSSVFSSLLEEMPCDEDGLPLVCVRIRAHASVPSGVVQDVMVAMAREHILRLSLTGTIDGREVEIGPIWGRPPLPAEVAAKRRRGAARDRGETGADLGTENLISNIPLGGTGVVGNLGVDGAVAGPYGFRRGGGRRRAALRGGGNRESEHAVEVALRWLVRHQEPNGRWDAAKSGGRKGDDAGVTGLAVLALLGAGHTEKAGEHEEAVTKAVDWIVTGQDESGCIGAGSPKLGYHHAICGLALVEAYGMAGLERTRIAAQKAADYSVNVHQQKHGGWRYMPGQKGDTSVTGWFVCQLKFAILAGLRVDPKGFQGAIVHLDTVTEMPTPGVEFPGRATYIVREKGTPKINYTAPMTAVAMHCWQIMGWKRDGPLLLGGANYLLQHLPYWDAAAGPGLHGSQLDFYYWYFGSLAMFQMGGDWWKQWNACVRDMLVEKQHNRPDDPVLDGSWDPIGYSGAEGGRVFSTAMGAMCLETYYRYMPIYKR